ncbi:MAG: DUF4430 domain-containing protein [Planctomycetia bacterium]|nr:DUF4430 domain-containing protein [Planctomycetia bacterium]
MPNECLQPLGQSRRSFQTGCAIVVAMTCLGLTTAGAMAAEPKASTVRLAIDYGDGVQVHFTALPWREGMTVLDALNAAQAHPHGITFTHRGSGTSAMITKIGDLKNQGGGENSKNWIFYLNDKAGEVGAGSQRLKPLDQVLWKFEVYDYNS